MDAMSPASRQAHISSWCPAAPGPARITLAFQHFETECQYDYVFVYDGPSHNSTLIAALSGGRVPAPLVANSGHMLVHFYSDYNYVLAGFNATYTITR